MTQSEINKLCMLGVISIRRLIMWVIHGETKSCNSYQPRMHHNCDLLLSSI